MSEPKPPAKINNFKVNKPTIARSRNIEPMIYIKPREVEEVKQVVNSKVADEKLVHKPQKKHNSVKPPVISKGNKNGKARGNTRSSSRRKDKDS